MSLDICRAENSRHPEHLLVNINSSCYAYVSHVVELLREGGHDAYLMCKTNGEGQYRPPDWVDFTGPGLDGKPYTYTGVSHDALWCDGKQYDTAARANDSPDPIFNPDGSPMTAEPVWNEIPQQHWRPNNPPLKTSAPTPTPSVPSYESLGGDEFFRANVGVPLEQDMAMAGQPLNAGSSVWFSRTCYDCIAARFRDPNADLLPIAKKHRNEWRAIRGFPPVP